MYIMYIKINYLKYLQNIKLVESIFFIYNIDNNIYNIEMINYVYTALLIKYKLRKCTKSNICNPQNIRKNTNF